MRVRIARATSLAAAGALALVAAVLLPAPAMASHDGSIHPGVVTTTEGAQCTSNFIYTDGTDVFIGMAAHCAGTGPATATNGCNAESLPLGTEVTVDGAEHPGELVYSSWLAMQAAEETDPNACEYNDFALVELHPDDVDNVTTSVPVFGGPTGLDTDGTEAGERIYTYGNSPLRAGLLSTKTGFSSGTIAEGWAHTVVTLTPGVPGDSGSGVMDAEGEAIGVLITLQLAPLPGSNGAVDLEHALDYANEHGSRLSGDVELVEGQQPFSPSLLGLGLGLL